MRYIEDRDFKYNDILVKHLRAYNHKHTGDREVSVEYYYAIEGDRLVGAIYTNLFWDWVSIDNIFYVNIEVLKKLISEICLHYSNRAVGIKLITEIESYAKEFQMLGFELIGVMEGTPKTKRSFHLKNIDFTVESNTKLEVVIATEKIVEYDLILQNQMERINKENDIQDVEEKNIMFVALDNNKFAGGIQASITEDSMYIARLVVSEEYRGKQIGTNLMNIIEDKARMLGIYSISTGTVEFQARGFYEKQGFKVVMIKENDPRGFDSYKMTKRIKAF
jgi:N-acetylglutamate synthase-like GNAT family acetyltransferase